MSGQKFKMFAMIVCMGDWLSGRASRLHRGGQRFESVIAHHVILVVIALILSACGRDGDPERPTHTTQSAYENKIFD